MNEYNIFGANVPRVDSFLDMAITVNVATSKTADIYRLEHIRGD